MPWRKISLCGGIKEVSAFKDMTIEKYRKMCQTTSREVYLRYGNEGRFVTYEPLGINNWYVFSILVEDD